MKRQSYFTAERESAANIRVTDKALAVNCTGVENITEAFECTRVRRDFYLMYAIEGNMDIFVKGLRQRFFGGSFILFAPETKYSYSNKNEVLNYYFLHFSGSRAEKIVKRLGIPLNTVTEIGENAGIYDCFTRLFVEFAIRDDNFDGMTAALLTEILTCISRLAKNHKKAVRLLKSISYIHGHFAEDIPIKKLADMEHLSITHFRTVFKKHTGMSPVEYITLQRINSACYYLTQTNLSVAETAALVGFCDPLYFSRVFKKKTGIPPGRYKKRAATKS